MCILINFHSLALSHGGEVLPASQGMSKNCTVLHKLYNGNSVPFSKLLIQLFWLLMFLRFSLHLHVE